MSLLVAVKAFGDLCLYAAAAATLARWAENPAMALLWSILLASVGVGLGGMAERRRWIRIPALAIPLLGLFFVKNTLDLLLLAPILAYTAAVILRGRYDLDHGHYYDFFFRGLAGLGLFLLFTLVGMDWRPTLFYGSLYLLVGFFLLRQLRLGAGNGWQDKALNLTALLTAVATGGLVCAAVWGLYKFGTLLLQLLWIPLRYLLEALWLLLQLLPIGELPPPPPIPEGTEYVPDLPLPPYDFEPGAVKDPVAAGPLALAIVVTTLFLIGVFFLVRRMLRILAERRDRTDSPVYTERVSASPRRRREAPGSNREKIRAIYRKFLQLIRRRGAKLRPADTSAEVLVSSARLTDPAAAEALRALYLTARYDEDRDVSDQQVKEAKELLKTLQREKSS